jgi:hypothetical protein
MPSEGILPQIKNEKPSVTGMGGFSCGCFRWAFLPPLTGNKHYSNVAPVWAERTSWA